jgi:hypothetical protein
MPLGVLQESIKISLAFVVALGAATAHADGGCAKGWRDVTAAERATMTAVVEAAKKAMPPAPEGWVVRGEDSVTMPTTLCIDQDTAPWVYAVSRSYYHAAVQEARNEVITSAATDMAAQMEAKQPRLDAVMAKMNAVSAEIAAAAAKADYARTEELGTQMQKLSDEYKAILEEGGTTEKMNAAAAEASRDLDMRVVVRVNALYASHDVGAEVLRPPAGAQSALRWKETNGGVSEGHALVLLGPWQPSGEGALQAVPAANAPAPAAQVISVTVAADESRLASTLDAIDFSVLAQTLPR